MDKNNYPKNWDEIAARIKELAGWLCERCGSPSTEGKILTVHHLDGDTKNNTDYNLVALCQGCHLHVQAKYIPGQMFLLERPPWAVRRSL